MTDVNLSEDDRRALRALAGQMIPVSAKYRAPGADDPAIFADVLASFGMDAAAIHEALNHLRTLSGGCYADLSPERQRDVTARFRQTGGEPLLLLSRVILQCYYRDERVMRSLDMDVRPPFPKGHSVEQGDWSLLNPVRERGKIWRDAP